MTPRLIRSFARRWIFALLNTGQINEADRISERVLGEAVTANSQNDLSSGSTLIANHAAVTEAQGRFGAGRSRCRSAHRSAQLTQQTAGFIPASIFPLAFESRL